MSLHQEEHEHLLYTVLHSYNCHIALFLHKSLRWRRKQAQPASSLSPPPPPLPLLSFPLHLKLVLRSQFQKETAWWSQSKPA